MKSGGNKVLGYAECIDHCRCLVFILTELASLRQLFTHFPLMLKHPFIVLSVMLGPCKLHIPFR